MYLNETRDRPIVDEARKLADSFHEKGGRVAFMDSGISMGWLVDVKPDWHYHSTVGRFDDSLKTSRVAVGGGFVGMCQTRTMISLIHAYFKRRLSSGFRVPSTPLTIDIPMAAAFFPRDMNTRGTGWRSSTTEHPTYLDYYLEAISQPGPEKAARRRKLADGVVSHILEKLCELEFERAGDFSLRVSIDGELAANAGTGPKYVNINLWSTSDALLKDVFGE